MAIEEGEQRVAIRASLDHVDDWRDRHPHAPESGGVTGDDAAGPRQRAHAFAFHLDRPRGRGHTPHGAFTGAAGGAACGDLIRVSLALQDGSPHGRIDDAGFDASGCGATIAAGSAAVTLVRDATLLDAARIGAAQIAAQLGGLMPAKMHAAELAADALHRALGLAARAASLAPVDGRSLVAMSGGVDSAVAALLTARDGQQAVAVTLELWADAENDGQRSCCSAAAVRGARSLAHRLGLPHLSIDLRDEFKRGVIEPWLTDHAAGLTPYACVRCNGQVRLDGMLDLAQHLGASALVTGHYARVERARPDAPLLRVAVDQSKDQSYALAALPPRSLARTHFPLGGLTKEQVRTIAADAGLAVARKRDSQDLCFLAGTSERAFLQRHGGLRPRPGPVLDGEGRVLGQHDGVDRFTIGQRRGLQLGGGQPRFVTATHAASNTITVGSREQLLVHTIEVADAVLLRDGAGVDAAKIRYRGQRLRCAVEVCDDEPGSDAPPLAGSHPRLRLRFEQPLERTAPGQLACLYGDDLLIGYGTIACNSGGGDEL